MKGMVHFQITPKPGFMVTILNERHDGLSDDNQAWIHGNHTQ